MTLTSDDLKAISQIIDEKLKPVHEFIDYAKPTLVGLVEFTNSASKKINDLVEFSNSAKAKLDKLEEFSDFAEKALTSLLDESQEHFEQKLPHRVKKLEDIHIGGHHAN